MNRPAGPTVGLAYGTRWRTTTAVLLVCAALLYEGALVATASAQSATTQTATLYLEVVVNGLATERVVAVESRNDQLFLDPRDLASLGIPVESTAGSLVPLDEIANVEHRYDRYRQRLEITVPIDWLPAHTIGMTRIQQHVTPQTSFGMVFNYDLHGAMPDGRDGHLSIWTEQRLFDRWGVVSNNGVVRRGAGPRGVGGRGSYMRYDTRWSYADEGHLLSFAAGDVVTGALPWTSAIRLGGIVVERSFASRPDIVTYPLPQFAGQAAVPTAVDVFVNGSHALSDEVPPGPFVVNTVPIVEGAGRATVVTTDALGRETSTNVSFYVASNLLQRGLFTYSASAGVARRTFGLSSWSYKGPAASGSFRYGLTNFITVAGHAEAGDRIASGGAGADLRLHTFGVLGGSLATGGHSGSNGLQYSASYSYARRRFSVMLQRLERQRDFADLSEYGQSLGDPLAGRLSRRVDQVTAALAPPVVGGTVGFGYFSVDNDEAERQRLINLSYSRRFVLGTSVYLSATQALGQGRRPTARFQVVRTLGRQGNLTATSASPGGPESVRVQYSRSAPFGGGVGWTAGMSPRREGHQQADVTWRTPHAQVQGGVYGKPASLTRWVGLSGSFVMLGREIAATNRVDDAFVVVDASGQEGVPVLFENQIVGRTNGRGRLMVPGVSAYYASKFAIDPLALPSGVAVDLVEQRAAVRPRSGAVVRFPLLRNLSALVTLVDPQGQPLAMGLSVTHVETEQQGIVGWDGLAYFEGLRPRNLLRVDWPDGRSCAVVFVVDPDSTETAQIGPLTCQPSVEQ